MSTAMFGNGDDKTIRSLLAAYQGEMNTQAKYKKFASKADDERLFGVGSLFRATARAEQIHANNQARAIRQLGGEATVVLEPGYVGSTLENLKAALAGEEFEIKAVYPSFIEEATAHVNATAARAFVWALEAERTHARLFAEAITQVQSGRRDSWIGPARDFYVCPVCACTLEQKNGDNCAICNYPSERLEAVR
jgi:rubrerythrin